MQRGCSWSIRMMHGSGSSHGVSASSDIGTFSSICQKKWKTSRISNKRSTMRVWDFLPRQSVRSRYGVSTEPNIWLETDLRTARKACGPRLLSLSVKLTRNPQKTLRSIRGVPEQLIGFLIVLRFELRAE